MSLMRSWVESANGADTPFPLNNLPYGVFWTEQSSDLHCGVAIGDFILDVTPLEADYFEYDERSGVFESGSWNRFMSLGPDIWAEFREKLTEILREGSACRGEIEHHLVPISSAHLEMPFVVSEFTDFYASRHHATNVGTMFRGAENALPPNWLHMPIGYNGRASSVVISGTDIIRPNGQTKSPDAEMPSFGPCRRLDFELELGAIVGGSSPLGHPISVAEADDMIFGYVLLNDWSARDIQAWEYQPLGPFQSKAFASSISPWIVPKAALEPFRAPSPPRSVPLLPYLSEPGPMLYDIDLEVRLAPVGQTATTITRTNYNRMYYSAPQQLAHHAASGCAMRVGDLLGSGTISGPEKSRRGCLLELTWGGQEQLTLDTGERRTFLEDGDTLTLSGAAKGDGYQIGFGDCTGTIQPARNFPA